MSNLARIPSRVILRHAGLTLSLALLLVGCTSTGSRTAAIAADKEASRIQAAFPAENITSVDSAMQAKDYVEKERAQVQQAFRLREQECYDSFFTTRCLNAAQDKQRASLNAVRHIEVEAEAFLRQEKVRKRDEELAKKQDKNDATENSSPPAEGRAMPRADEDETAMPVARSPEELKTGPETNAGPDPRVLRHQQERRQQEAREAAEAPARAEKARKLEEKQREAEIRQQEIARDKAEKALREDARKNAETE